MYDNESVVIRSYVAYGRSGVTPNIITGCFPPIDITSITGPRDVTYFIDWFHYKVATSLAPLRLYREAHISFDENTNLTIKTRFHPPPILATIEGAFPTVNLHAVSEIVAERTSMIGTVIHTSESFYPDGKKRQVISQSGCTFMEDEKGRDCKLPETGSFMLYKAGTANPYLQNKKTPLPIIDVYVDLFVPKESARLNVSCPYGPIKCRVQRARVVNIYTRSKPTAQLQRAYSILSPNPIEYVVGQEVQADSFDTNCFNQCTGGIYGCPYRDQCDAWFS